MHTDSCFVIGNEHIRNGKPCQDYVESGLLAGGGAYLVAADGCSTGGRTDFGSRVLARATTQAIAAHWSAGGSPPAADAARDIAAARRANVASSRQALGLGQSDLLATCVYAYVGPGGGYAMVNGDGLVAQQFTDGSLLVHRLEWERNAPCYPAYEDDDYAAFIEFHGGDLEAPALTVERWRLTGAASELEETRFVSLSDGIRGYRVELGVPGVKAIAVFTDGAAQVDKVEWQETVTRLLAFKTTPGQFVVRRINRFVQEVKEVGRGPIDDLGYAVVLMDEEEHDERANC